MRTAFVGLVLSLLIMAAGAARAEGVWVGETWARATAADQSVSALYLAIESSENARLVDVRCPLAQGVELHQTTVEAGVARMRVVEQIDLPGRKTVSLAPGGYHVMLTGLKQPLKPGEIVPFTLILIASDGVRYEVETNAKVRNLDGSEPAAAR